jgi:hypothetical protein
MQTSQGSAPRCADRRVHIARIARGALCVHRAGGRLVHLQPTPAGRFHRGTADEMGQLHGV